MTQRTNPSGGDACRSGIVLLIAFAYFCHGSLIEYSNHDFLWAMKFGMFAREIVGRPSSCITNNTVYHTMSNIVNWPMVELQVISVARHVCFIERFIVITLDDPAHDACKQSRSVMLCYRYHRTFGLSEYLSGDYVEVVFVKIKSLYALLQMGLTAIYFDADVTILQLPLLPQIEAFDIVAQMERYNLGCEIDAKKQNCKGAQSLCSPPSNVLGSNINSGQLGLSPSPKTLDLLNSTIACGLQMTVPRGNQFCLKMVLRAMQKKKINLRIFYFPSEFGSHRWASMHLEKGTSFVTYHAHLAGRSFEQKYTVLKKLLKTNTLTKI